MGLWFGVGALGEVLARGYADADNGDACGCRGPCWRHCRVSSSRSCLYHGVSSLVEKLVHVFRLALTASADVISSMEALLSESPGGCCWNR
jgi:hypothetical protein